MALTWTPIATAMLMTSSIATLGTMLHLRLRWDVHASSVRWLFWLFFSFVFAWCSLRSVFFVWFCLQPSRQLVDEDDLHRWTYAQLDRLGIHGVLYLRQAKSTWITIVLCAGDTALFGIALSLLPLTDELCRLARLSMDRGVAKEQRRIRLYRAVIGICVVAYATLEAVLTIRYRGYNVHTHRCLLGVYVIQFAGLAFMCFQLLRLKTIGRKYETVHGTFVASPVYRRLKMIMLIYAVFSFQFQFSVFVMYLRDLTPDSPSNGTIGVSLILYNMSGLALAVTTSCSQACVFSACSSCMPEDLEAQFHQRQLGPSTEADSSGPPYANPVFVYTDIEASSSLWGLAGGHTMAAATEIHDGIMRSAMFKHRGYEITTVGDAFQVAFHTIRDAVEYCMDVQLQLLVAKWPKELHGMIPATEKVRAGRKLIFNGLRVRMGIHDAADSEGPLVQDVHAVTGKTTYTGVSELIAEYVSDLGGGGQILVTGRVASWLLHHRDELSVDVFINRVGAFLVPQVATEAVEIFELLPSMLAGRARLL